MTQQLQRQKLPSDWPAREALRAKGQFWTPPWIAEAMVAYCLAEGSASIFDPAVGAGAFLRAAKELAQTQGRQIALRGAELDREVLQQALSNGLSADDLAQVEVRDFVLHPPDKRLPAIVANPPYIRHHRLAPATKEALRRLSAELIGESLDGRAGLHIYFLLRALQVLAEGGRLAFIMPADTCEGVFARKLWQWVTSHYCLEAVVTFTPEASPFPNVDTNPIIFLISRTKPRASFFWAQCRRPATTALKHWMGTNFSAVASDEMEVCQRQVAEALSTGLSRPVQAQAASGLVLGDFAKVMRGIATGANDFFFLTRQQAVELQLPPELLLPAVGRTRDVAEDQITEATLRRLEEAGRPTLLFAPDGRELALYLPAVRAYLRRGEAVGLHERPLIAQRHPWHRMEVRRAPEFLFAYLGRRNARFIRNLAGVMPLTGFLCVYPHRTDAAYVEKLWAVLQRPDTTSNLALVGKSYGAGALKVEPRALERLPLPEAAVTEIGLLPAVQQPTLYSL